jgi:putative signal transducing protein
MKRVYSGGTLADVAHVQNLLEHAGIRSFMKNVNLGGALGDLPFLDCTPELWVLVDADAARAENVIRDALRPQPGTGAAAWRCAGCGEQNEPQFGVCWSCGAAAPPS